MVREIQGEKREEANSVFVALRQAVVILSEIVTLWVVGVVVTSLCILALWVLVQAVAGG